MKMADSYKARVALNVAIAKIFAAAQELNRKDIDINHKFGVAWDLGFGLRQELEEFRVPKGCSQDEAEA